MKLDFNIGLAQKQGLSLTLQVQQAIKLLQMTNLEVNEYIEENFLENPFVELHDQSLKALSLRRPMKVPSQPLQLNVWKTPHLILSLKNRRQKWKTNSRLEIALK